MEFYNLIEPKKNMDKKFNQTATYDTLVDQ